MSFAKQGGYTLCSPEGSHFPAENKEGNMFNKITLGPITIYMYGLMIAIGFASALLLCNYRGKKRG